ncbi:TRAFAC clade GTPase domain-containing protein [Phaeobacter gallaeciensis]|uniref:TRAFAC clade GTPase domain-containing protein n=1 Tax=Phaeobacter gallaeciensis TaxID=60890 RepID=UPI00237FB76F|nr:hypothetical protein [Phaeobacter gallaeciensis]MDE4139999.1 hypothetical protein [Phaeobacter gallaeciensis]MDE4148391.1 hypothetical protein [Phaeobacter gallaeciensis]MDE4152665.1 hypothetical protein [Phaeobacter gallaeciensis]MDE4228001.1 hypothetical protein [Phaeobacter gallaeciensis]MDE4257130.1 hypothetical protein [Phaeobacter gallaeciensis]
MSSQHHIILGYPESGKTTYLAAFWHVIEAGEGTTSLTLDRITGDAEYLNTIVESWLRCEQVPRTYLADEQKISLHVRDSRTDDTMVLSLPDFSGETFQEIFADRHCEQDLFHDLDENGGILFFVNADRANDMMSVLDHAFAGEGDEIAGSNSDDVLQEFDARKVPEQTRIVDMLQLLQRSPFTQQKRRIVFVVSAWDVTLADKITPQEWVGREMPLLDQYLKNNAELYEARFCGISAQGGVLTGATRESLLEQDPEKRVICHWDGKSGQDITLPLWWLGANEE